tara:strand:+ start:73 stop:558 length:486 start_codon:yes stop_codon:yes gene_type:complete
MDTISHALWGKGLFGYRKYRWLPLFFGAIPDLTSFGIYFLFNLIINPNTMRFGKPELSEIPSWVISLYNISHSLIIAMIFILIAYLLKKDLCFPMLAWPFHIILDFFTHSIEYFPTPIFWPLSNYRFDGIPWSNPYIMIINAICIFLIFIYRKNDYLIRRK